jgi:Rrf2 family protein
MLSQRSRYALKALLHLARAEPAVLCQIAVIAEAEDIPRKFLEVILVQLKQHGLVRSTRGAQGGYQLARPAAKISFGLVIRLFEGPIALVPCASKTAYRRCDDCKSESKCAIRKLMIKVREDTAKTLDSTSLAQAASANFKVSSLT